LYPQSTYRIWPVTALARSLHRKSVAFATSSGLIGRGSGDRLAAYSIDFSNSPGRIDRAARLAYGPAEIRFTRMFFPPRLLASCLASICRAAFAVLIPPP
jgi:hypothetical protein